MKTSWNLGFHEIPANPIQNAVKAKSTHWTYRKHSSNLLRVTLTHQTETNLYHAVSRHQQKKMDWVYLTLQFKYPLKTCVHIVALELKMHKHIQKSLSVRKTSPLIFFGGAIRLNTDNYYYLIDILSCKSNLFQKLFNCFYTLTKKWRTDKFKSGPKKKTNKQTLCNVVLQQQTPKTFLEYTLLL